MAVCCRDNACCPFDLGVRIPPTEIENAIATGQLMTMAPSGEIDLNICNSIFAKISAAVDKNERFVFFYLLATQ